MEMMMAANFYLFLAHLGWVCLLAEASHFFNSKGINEEGDGIGDNGRLISKDIINSTGQNSINNTKVIALFAQFPRETSGQHGNPNVGYGNQSKGYKSCPWSPVYKFIEA